MRTFILVLFVYFAFSFSSCQKEEISKLSLQNLSTTDVNAKSGTQTFTLGQSFGGGYIFYIDATGQHGLIISANKIDGGPFKYGKNNSTTVIGAFDLDGLVNTKRIIQFYGSVARNTIPYAAYAAKNYKGGGFSDWYLPSYSEWEKINAARNNGVNLNIGLNDHCITSSEDPWNYVGIQVLYFNSYGPGGILGTYKDVAYDIRAVRKF